MNELLTSNQVPQGCNNTFIPLITKIESPSGFKEFKLISMVGSMYKIISKLLASRLQKVMDYLIGPQQSFFIKGRQILDSPLNASELINSCKKNKVATTILKLGFHKAFGSVSWSFLDWTLKSMNFPPLWRVWIQTCIMSAWTSVLVNGSPSRPFKLQRGLRQGDPISPFLFNLVAESLNLFIQKAVSIQLWDCVEACHMGPKITHLQFADDTMIFCPPREE